MNKIPIELIIVAPDYALYQAFQQQFDYLPNVEVANCNFEQLSSYDCLVSPANSFGMMDGGIDAAITAFFGMQLMERVQQRILDDYLGEQSVGTSFMIETGHPQYPFTTFAYLLRRRFGFGFAGAEIDSAGLTSGCVDLGELNIDIP